MRLRNKLFVVMLPVVVAGLALQWLVGSYVQDRQWASQHEALLTQLLDNAALRIVEERQRDLAAGTQENAPIARARHQAAALAGLARLAGQSGTDLFVLDGDGNVLLPSGPVPEAAERLSIPGDRAFQREIGGTTYLLVARHFAPWDWTLLGGYPADARLAPIRRVNLAVTSSLLLTGLLMTLSLFVGLDRLVVRPIRLLGQGARTLARRRQPLDLQLDGKDEIGELAFEMDEMARAIAAHTGELERSNAELDHFASVVGHELRTPLRAIVNAAAWLEADAGPLPQAALDHLDRLRDSARCMDAMLQDLLRHAQAGQIVGTTRRCAVRELIEAQLALLAPLKAVTLEIEAPVATPITAEASLALVMRNLMENIIRHHDRDSVHLRVDVHRRERRVVFRITDDGPGIPTAEHDRVLDIHQARHGSGAGMSVALIRRIVQRLGGEMHIESDGGARGSTVVLEWPLDGTFLANVPPPVPPARLAAAA